MKHKRIVSLLLCIVLAVALACPAFAADSVVLKNNTYDIGTVTISGPSVEDTRQYVNVVNYMITYVYKCTGPVTVEYTMNTNAADFYAFSLTPGGNTAMPFEFVDMLACNENVTLTDPGFYVVALESWEYPVKITGVIHIVSSEDAAPQPEPEVKYELKSFSDVAEGWWSYDAIMEMVDMGLFNGVTDPDKNGVGTFGRTDKMTRGQFITVATRILYADDLAQMEEGLFWYSKYYDLAIEKGLVTSGEFAADTMNAPITREEMAMVAVRVAELQGKDMSTLAATSDLVEYEAIGAYYTDYVRAAYATGLLHGTDGVFNPDSFLSREEGAMVAYRLVNEAVLAG